ncbi:RluA family pseudouridine synthase [Lewinella sp. IMCC34183]|uniref:RluA family pseudouridine synthase n=1 Tax=Lewinella sp. IMCC34183 TaxID=2248762 RepID=UPI0013008F7B|nr:RNA pseudouridine synthase [Lewinella sp. IMCC34183]
MLDILREGPGWAVVNKPAGIATERHFQYDTLEARAQVQWTRDNAKRAGFVGIVHRLDRATSGALVLARNKSTLVRLNRSFAARSTTKRYLAVTDRPLPEATGRLHHYLLRNATNKLAVASTRPVAGAKEAILSYRLLREGEGSYLYEVTPVTGRFHQIRCQFAAAGAPIVGDHAYGALRPLRDHCIALHAHRLSFPDPADEDAVIETVAPLPEYWPLPPATE